MKNLELAIVALVQCTRKLEEKGPDAAFLHTPSGPLVPVATHVPTHRSAAPIQSHLLSDACVDAPTATSHNRDKPSRPGADVDAVRPIRTSQRFRHFSYAWEHENTGEHERRQRQNSFRCVPSPWYRMRASNHDGQAQHECVAYLRMTAERSPFSQYSMMM